MLIDYLSNIIDHRISDNASEDSTQIHKTNLIGIHFFAKTIIERGDAQFKTLQKAHTRTRSERIYAVFSYIKRSFMLPSQNLKASKITLAKVKSKLKTFQDTNAKELSKIKRHIKKYKASDDKAAKIFVKACKSNGFLRMEKKLKAAVTTAHKAVSRDEAICRLTKPKTRMSQCEEDFAEKANCSYPDPATEALELYGVMQSPTIPMPKIIPPRLIKSTP